MGEACAASTDHEVEQIVTTQVSPCPPAPPAHPSPLALPVPPSPPAPPGASAVRAARPVPEPVPDEVLSRRAGLGDRRSFEVIVDRHGPAMHRFAWRMLDDPADVQDCLQDAFTDAWRGLPGFRGEAALRTWLFTLTAHAVRRHQRRRRPAAVPDDQLEAMAGAADRGSDPGAVAEHGGLVAALDAALGRLPPGQRAVWLLREVDDLSYADIARVTATTTDTVRGRLARARAALEEQMEPWR